MTLSVSTAFSRRIFDDGLEAAADPRHPCHHMLMRQMKPGIAPLQMPEPFSGKGSSLRLVFVGLNPSLSDDEIIPTVDPEWTFERYDEHYRQRFAAGNRNSAGRSIVRSRAGGEDAPRLWSNIELMGSRYFSGEGTGAFRLGEHALLAEVVHYKSRRGWLGNAAQGRQVLRHHLKFNRDLFDEISPCILAPMGNVAFQQICVLYGLENHARRTITEATAQLLEARSTSGEQVFIVPVKHLSYPPRHAVQAAFGSQICRAIDALNR